MPIPSDDQSRIDNDPARNMNQRLPPLHLPGIYPYVSMYQDRQGSWTREDCTPNNESYSRGHISGTFQEHTPLGGKKSLTAAMDHHYTTQGHTQTVDLNSHDKIGGSTVAHVSQDHFSEHYQDKMHAIGRHHIHAAGGNFFQHATHRNETTSTGDHASDHNDGNHHYNVSGDHVQYSGGTKYDYIGGEKGTYLPNGNYDIKLDKGKFQVNSYANMFLTTSSCMTLNATSNILITSTTSITLQVGSQSIVINTSGITINATVVNFNKV